jgi:hypothetical protein
VAAGGREQVVQDVAEHEDGQLRFDRHGVNMLGPGRFRKDFPTEMTKIINPFPVS